MNRHSTRRARSLRRSCSRLSAVAQAETIELKASHQWPGGKGDIRDEMVQMIARHMESANTGVHITVYQANRCSKPKEQWGAMTKGKLDITASRSSYTPAAGTRNSTSRSCRAWSESRSRAAPEQVRVHEPYQEDHGRRWRHGAGRYVARGRFRVDQRNAHLEPDDVKGMKYRAAGKAFEQMLRGAGASITDAVIGDLFRPADRRTRRCHHVIVFALVSYRI